MGFYIGCIVKIEDFNFDVDNSFMWEVGILDKRNNVVVLVYVIKFKIVLEGMLVECYC